MIKYNCEKIPKASKYVPARIMLIIHMLTYPRLPKNFKDPTMKYQGQSFEGFSFLLNPEKLLANRKKYGNQQCAEYVSLASYRSYMEYQKTGDTSLQLISLPFVEDIFNNNRLLTMKDGIIHFKFEDTK